MKICLVLVIAAFVVNSALAGYSVPMNHVRSYIGQSVHNGECASGVQQIFKDHYGSWVLGLTRSWNRGRKVYGNSVEPGTAIASFTSNGRYWGHAAIYSGQNSHGVQVYDQWRGRNFNSRTLSKYYRGTKPQSNHADYFYVIEN